MTLHPHQPCVALKRKPAARGKRAPRMPSIVDVFYRLPSPEFAADSVAPPAFPLARAAERALFAGMREDAQNDSMHATILNGPAAVETAEPSPRFDEPARLFHVGRSDSPVQ